MKVLKDHTIYSIKDHVSRDIVYLDFCPTKEEIEKICLEELHNKYNRCEFLVQRIKIFTKKDENY